MTTAGINKDTVAHGAQKRLAAVVGREKLRSRNIPAVLPAEEHIILVVLPSPAGYAGSVAVYLHICTYFISIQHNSMESCSVYRACQKCTKVCRKCKEQSGSARKNAAEA